MTKIFRFSGYFVDGDINQYDAEGFKGALTEIILGESTICKFQQLHIEESEDFSNDVELEENCDLALLTRHFKKESNYDFDRPLPVAGQKYRHFKIGKVVTVIGISRHTETEEVSVVYEYEGTIWNRPLGMFMSEVDRNKYPNSKQKYRFELIGGDDYDR
jgi:hypothetical protein